MVDYHIMVVPGFRFWILVLGTRWRRVSSFGFRASGFRTRYSILGDFHIILNFYFFHSRLETRTFVRVSKFVFRASVLGTRHSALGTRYSVIRDSKLVHFYEFRVFLHDIHFCEFGVWSLVVQGFGCRVSDFGTRYSVKSFEFWVSGFGFQDLVLDTWWFPYHLKLLFFLLETWNSYICMSFEVWFSGFGTRSFETRSWYISTIFDVRALDFGTRDSLIQDSKLETWKHVWVLSFEFGSSMFGFWVSMFGFQVLVLGECQTWYIQAFGFWWSMVGMCTHIVGMYSMSSILWCLHPQTDLFVIQLSKPSYVYMW
jgi:hypothetical protein